MERPGTDPPGEREHGKLKILNPADYPTDLIQPVFELLRRHKNFRAAWIFGATDAKPQPASGRGYQLLLLMEPRDAVIFHDLNMTVAAARRRPMRFAWGCSTKKT